MEMRALGFIVFLLTAVTMRANLNIPAQHPYLALTPQDIAQAKERVAQFGWAKQSLTNLIEEASGIVARPLGKLPERGNEAHWGISQRLFTAAVAHALTGDKRFAEWVRDGLLAYADLYPTLPMTRGRCKIFTQSSLYEAMWLVPIAQAYDLAADSGVLSDVQKKRIEDDLLRAAVACFKVDDYERDPRIHDLHYRCYNFQAWHLSAAGLVGLALRDAALVDWAVNSRYGLKHLIAHDIRDDGLFWERSVGYHHFVINALLPFTEAMMRCGVDLYGLAVPNDRSKNEDTHYVTDTSDKPKSFRPMFEAPFYLAFPDLSHVAPGDSGRGPLRASWMHLIGHHRYRDPKLAWLLRRDVPLAMDDTERGRIGFLHYYRYAYRHENVRLNGKPATWSRRDATLEVEGDALVARDGGESRPDCYALNDTDAASFTLEWATTRLANSGPQDRAWLLFHTSAANPANRKSFALTSHLPEINRRYQFRLEVKDGAAKLLRDGRVISTNPTVYRYGPDWRWLIYDMPSRPAGKLALAERFANTGVYRNGCTLFPSSGLVVLRQAQGDFTMQPDSTAVTLSYGPYGGGHGHPDKLNIVLYAQGRQWIPDFGSMPYESRLKSEWTAHTVSHNTVVVDGVSQKPTGARDIHWPVDDARSKVIGQLVRFDPSQKLAAASCTNAYDNLILSRTVQLRGNCAVDCFEISPANHSSLVTHDFDYVLHIDGALTDSTTLLSPRSGRLGGKCGYQHVELRQGGTIRDATALTFTSGAKRLRLWILPADNTPTELVIGEGLTNAPDAKMPMVVIRRSGERTRFVTVFEPMDGSAPLTAVRLAGQTVTLQRDGRSERISLR